MQDNLKVIAKKLGEARYFSYIERVQLVKTKIKPKWQQDQ